MDNTSNNNTPIYGFLIISALFMLYAYIQNVTLLSYTTQITTPVAIWSDEQLAQFQEKYKQEIAFDNMQIACITFTLYGESRSKKQIQDTIGVANVVMNRSYSEGFPKTPCKVVTQRYQIEPLAKGKPLRKYVDITMGGTVVIPSVIANEQWIRLRKIAKNVYTSQLPDPTNGATHFWSPSAQRALGRKPPRWSYTFRHVASLGDHRYYTYQ